MAEDLELAPAVPEISAPERASIFPPRLTLLLGCGIAILATFGCLGIYRELVSLWILWTGDPLRSIGLLIPPVSILLTLRVWRQCDWEINGTWWGLLVIGFAFLLSWLRHGVLLMAVAGRSEFSLIPVSLPLYVYGSGIVLLFAGIRVWRKAWFPLGLLLFSQPVPGLANGLIDIPLQNISARVARSFATFIGFTPTTPQLRLMFSPNFGMFIAPGCDGIRGAITMGYVALILGYLKRVSFLASAALVAGAVLLGYLFNFIRLCVLVLYYRAALGHPSMEGFAKQADYLIGSCLFLVATLLFVRLARSRQSSFAPNGAARQTEQLPPRILDVCIKFAAFAVVILAALALPASALRTPKSVSDPASLASRMPKQVGGFSLTRTWYEQEGGIPVVESAAYSTPGSDEVILGIWIGPLTHFHNAQQCWLARGLQPDLLTTGQFVTANGESIPLSTGFYSDGITDSIVVNAACNAASCSMLQQIPSSNFSFLFLKPRMGDFSSSGTHVVSIMVRIDKLHSDAPKAAIYGQLTDEAQKFFAGVDPFSLSRAFQ